jgi:predicted Zn-dependent protease
LTALVTVGVWYFTPISHLLVDFMLELVPVQADLELGREAYLRDKHLSQDTYYDPRWTRHLQRIGRQLVESSASSFPHAAAAPNNYQWDFAVVKDDLQINALCLPGGIVRVTSGLLKQLDLTDGELAALLGHEMGHVLHRHGQARILQQKVLQTIMEALVYQDNDDHEETLGEAIGELLVHSADWLGQQSFSRANEYEADETSWELLLSPHNPYHPQALQGLLTKLWDASGRQGGKTSWDSTHPGTLDRIQALEQKWKSLSSRERREIDRKYAVR